MLAASAAVAVAIAVGTADPDGDVPSALPFDGRSPVVADGGDLRVLVSLRRPSLGERMAREPLAAADQRAYVRSLRHEADALQSALRAKDVRLAGIVSYERVWNGFAATIRPKDLPRIQTLGARAQPVRRFYPAAARIAQAEKPATRARPRGPRGPVVALLDSGVDLRHTSLAGRVIAGRDTVDLDRDPAPARAPGGRIDQHGTQVAGALLGALGGRGRVLAIRVAGLQRSGGSGVVEEAGTTDQVLAGLESAVDPDGDGDSEDAVRVALMGVSSPYAGFAGAPEAEAAAGAAGLGTLVVAPAGNEGAGLGRFGTVGSPAAAPAALAVGALEGEEGDPGLPGVRVGIATGEGRATLDGHLVGGKGRAIRAPVAGLSGPSQADPRARGRSAGGDVLAYFDVDARPRARGTVVVVPAVAGRDAPPPAAVAAAAGAAGASAVLICDPGGDRLRGIPPGAAGAIPVVGLAGDAARRALELTAGGGGTAFLSRGEPRAAAASDVRMAPSSSGGPTYGLARKPDVAAGGTATAPLAGGGAAFASGTSFAAARGAAAAALLAVTRPDLSAGDLRAALIAGAVPLSRPSPGAGAVAPAGVVDARRAARVPVLAAPAVLTLPAAAPGAAFSVKRAVRLRNPGRRAVTVVAAVSGRLPPGIRLSVRPRRVRLAAGEERSIAVAARGRGKPESAYLTGAVRLTAGRRSASIPWAIPVARPAPAPLGALRLIRQDGRVDGVRFSAGSVRREPAGYGIAVLPIGHLTLQLVAEGGGGTALELTPSGGARELLPGEYAYTLTGETLGELPAGAYRFVARARGPGATGARSERRSRAFEVR